MRLSRSKHRLHILVVVLAGGVASATTWVDAALAADGDGAFPAQSREDELKKKEEELRRKEDELRKKEEELRARESEKERKQREAEAKKQSEKEEKARKQREREEKKQREKEENERIQREREAKKQRAKEEREQKGKQDAAAAQPAAVAAPPDETPATSPPPTVAAAPEPVPIDRLGDAEWSTTLGFLAPGEPPADTAGAGGGARVPAVRAMTLNTGWFEFGGGQLQLNPINNGNSDSSLGFALLDIAFAFRFEWRNEASLFAPWFTFGGATMFGDREIQDPQLALPSDTTATLGVVGFRGETRFGVDLHPAQFVGIGPVIGGHFETYSASIAAESTSGSTPTVPDEWSDSTMQAELGLVYGVHARFRTRARPGAPAVFFADPAFTWKQGEFQTGQYASLQLGVRAGSMYFLGWYERRLDASGSFTFSNDSAISADTHTLSEDYAASSPIEQRLGVGMAVVMYGKD